MANRSAAAKRERPRADDAAHRYGAIADGNVVSLSIGGVVVEAAIADLSASGMMAMSPTEVLPHAYADIALPGGVHAAGQVRWCRDGAFGIEFLAPLPSTAVDSMARGRGARPMRLAVWSPVRMSCGDDTRSVVLRDISDGGLQLAGTDEIATDTHVVVELAPGLVLAGSVRWSQSGRTGVMLDDPLPPAAREWIRQKLMARS